jgi:hypothetical protein
MSLKPCLLAACLTTVVLALPGRTQEKKESVPRGASSEVLEKVLGELKIQYQKTAGKSTKTYFYNYDRNNYKIRLGNHGGEALWLAAAFPKASLQQINQWNVRAKFSRAVLSREGERETALVEAQLDCRGGVTAGIVRQFLERFDSEVREFDRFLGHE